MIILFPASTDNVGVAIHVLNLSKLLREQNLLSYVLCCRQGWLVDQLHSENIPYKIIPLSYNPSKFFVSSWRLFRALLHVENGTILHLHGRFPLFISLLSMLLNTKINYFATIHQFSDVGDHGWLSWKEHLETFLLNRLSRIGAVSKGLALEIHQRVMSKSIHNIFIVPNFIKRYDYPFSTNRSSDQHIKIIAIGRLSHEKGFDVLIQAIEYLIQTNKINITCSIYGEGPEKHFLSQLIHEKNLNESIFLEGIVDNDDLRHRLPNYHLMVIPSRSESFGLVALEAFNAQLPVIASNIPGLNEIVRDNDTGLLFDTEKPISLSAKIFLMLNHDTLKSKCTANAFEWFSHYTDREKILSDYTKFYSIGAKR